MIDAVLFTENCIFLFFYTYFNVRGDLMEKREGTILSVLSVMLVCAFLLSVWMYDDLAQSAQTGALAVFSVNVRNFIDENEAVAAFLGNVAEETDGADIATAASEYIARYNAIYASLS